MRVSPRLAALAGWSPRLQGRTDGAHSVMRTTGDELICREACASVGEADDLSHEQAEQWSNPEPLANGSNLILYLATLLPPT